MTKKPSRIIYSRYESQIVASPRHEMEVSVKLGADKEGHIKALDVYTLSNSGAYSEHGPTTVGLSGHKSIPLYSNYLEAHRFNYDVVYTNTQSAGAFRGYGAPQGIFAVESAVNELAARLNMNPAQIREINMVREGNCMHAYYDEFATSCALDRCLAKARQMIGWDENIRAKILEAIKCAASEWLSQCRAPVYPELMSAGNGETYRRRQISLVIGAADMGTGCDTILAQMVAECMECTVDDVTVYSADSDMSPYDSGSYASSTTYVTGNAVVRACETLKDKICTEGAVMLGVNKEDVVYENDEVRCLKDSRK